MCIMLCIVFFFKQKTAYEMRISDWSSDVCSSDLDFDDPGVRDTLFGYLKRLDRATVTIDAKAHLAFLDAQKEVDTAKGIGTAGYCMGGPMVIYTAARNHERVKAAASFNGASVGNDKPERPHLLIPETKAA